MQRINMQNLIYRRPTCRRLHEVHPLIVVCEQPGRRFMERARDYIKSIQEDISALNSSGRMQAKAGTSRRAERLAEALGAAFILRTPLRRAGVL